MYTLPSVKTSGAGVAVEKPQPLGGSVGALSGLRTCMLANMDMDLKMGDQSMILGHFSSIPFCDQNKLHLFIASWNCLLYTNCMLYLCAQERSKEFGR